MLEQLEQDLAGKIRVLDQKVGARDALITRRGQLEVEVSRLNEAMATTEKAVYLLQKYSEDQQTLLAARVEDIVTAGIRAVFQIPSLEFKMAYSESKGGGVKKTPEVKLSVRFERDGEMVTGSLRNSFGGGLAVVVSVLLNTIVVLHLAPRVAPVLILDEPLSDLSPTGGYRERMADFMKTLTEQTPVQLIVVSHEEVVGEAADRHYRFTGGIDRAPKIEDVSDVE